MLRGLMIMRWLAPADDLPQGSQTPSGQGNNGDGPKYVTEEQLNRAISARFGDFQKKLEKSFESSLGGITAKLEEIAKREPATGTPPAGGNPIDAKAIEEHPLFKGLQKQIADLQKKSEADQAVATAEKQKARDIALRQQIGDALTKAGLDPKYVKNAVGHLVDVEKRVRFADDDSDEIVFRDGTIDVDFPTGLKSWVKGDDAKIYLPARGTQGSGDHGHGKQLGNGQQRPPSVGAALLGMASQVVQTGGNQKP